MKLLAGLIGFPTLITIFVKNGIKNLNLINLCELIIATGNNNFWFLKANKCSALFWLIYTAIFLTSTINKNSNTIII